jgi:hypothetical protein
MEKRQEMLIPVYKLNTRKENSPCAANSVQMNLDFNFGFSIERRSVR